jgi:hypothetical protein
MYRCWPFSAFLQSVPVADQVLLHFDVSEEIEHNMPIPMVFLKIGKDLLWS